ncbi:MAG TPA: CmpA/NrtA family ABC transporter substrate-binding protein [Xanthobacteraceae bacterium]|nr:CmpA/NrtA family ABC transporter substrate-binding protein [Xanthobacteraceae bacterium]
MTDGKSKLRIGFIPLADATALIIAVDKGFTQAEGLEVELLREVSWSNMRDKLNIGLFDAAHLLAPIAIASSLGLGHVKVPIAAPFNLGLNGNAITVTNDLYKALADNAHGDLTDPKVSARALADVVAERRRKGREPLNFGMTFPFSTHNYQLRFWMASGGVDPDQDLRMVVLPPPYMVESISSGHVDGFCVGAPWNSVAVDLGIGHILHFVSEILQRATEKVLAVRASWAKENPDTLRRLIRAHGKAADFVEDVNNRDEVCNILAAPNRIGVAPEVIRRTLDGKLKTSPEGEYRTSDRYLMIKRLGAARPDPVQAAWLYAQMVRWGHAPMSNEMLAASKAVFRTDLYDAVLGKGDPLPASEPADGVGAFVGPAFDPNDIRAHLSLWKIRRW